MNDPGLEDSIQETEHVRRQQLVRDNPTNEDPEALVSQLQKQDTQVSERSGFDEHPKRLRVRYGSHEPNTHRRRHLNALSNEEGHGKERESVNQQSPLWWFMSTAFPLFAGTFGPIANLLSVCALVQTWRAGLYDGERIPDPYWLTGLNATSLFLALVANLILMFNFARRIRYSIAQPITITLWYLSCTLLLICFGLIHDTNDGPDKLPAQTAFTQSYYYGLISSILYFVVASLLLLSSLGSVVFHAYPPSFATLTGPQRTLMLQTTSFSVYLALGAGVFSAIEGWQFVDGIYWADYTLLTLGLGTDFPLKTVEAKMLLIPYAAFGITLVGLVVSSVRGLVLERAKAKVVRQHLGKERERWRKNIEERGRLVATHGKAEPLPAVGTQGSGNRLQNLLHLDCFRGRKEERLMKMPRKLSKHAGIPLKHFANQHGAWHRAEFELMRFMEDKSQRTERYSALFYSFLVILVVWVGGALIFWSCEKNTQGWSFTDAFYFSYTTLLTIGYGDFYPSTSAGKPFFVVWSLISVPAMTVLISNMGDTVVKAFQEVTVWVSKWTILPERNSSPRRPENHNSPVESTPSREPRGDDNYDTESQRPIPSSTAAHDLSQRQGSPTRGSSTSASYLDNSAGPTAIEKDVGRLSDQIGEFEESENRSGSLAARISREISKLAKDLRKKPPKRYTWEEWSVWLHLLGEREGSGAMANDVSNAQKVDAPHSTPVHIRPPHPSDKRSSAQPKSSTTNTAFSARRSEENQTSTPDHLDMPHSQHPRIYGQEGAARSEANLNTAHDFNWSWLGDQGPLFSPLTETEWIIGKLCFRLEEVLEDEIREARASTATQSDFPR